MEKIGVYLCECGPNIRDAIDLSALEKFARSLQGVYLVRIVNLLCSDNGQEIMRCDIEKEGLTHVVVAACSPKEHEKTFQKVLSRSGRNSYLLSIANIREQCAWVSKDKTKAFQKAMALLRAAVKRVVVQEPLEKKEIPVNADVAVIGSGISGISAALALAQKDRKVFLIEKLPFVGGKVARFNEVFPGLECASCLLDPKIDNLLHNENIELLLYSEVKEALGFLGNFILKVKRQPRYVDAKACIGCGACFNVCPVKVKNEYNEGLGERKAIYIPYGGAMPYAAVIDKKHCLRFKGQECHLCRDACPFGAVRYEDAEKIEEVKAGAVVLATGFDLFDVTKAPQYGFGRIDNVYTSMEFERILSPTGPTAGKIIMKNGKEPSSIAFIHCVGSKVKKINEYCSGVCCVYSLKFARMAHDKIKGVRISEFDADYCLPGKACQKFFDDIKEEKFVDFIHLASPDSIEIKPHKAGVLCCYSDRSGRRKKTLFDMVVLAPAIVPSGDAAEVAAIFDITLSEGGFFAEENSLIAPVTTRVGGVYIAGCCQGPKDIQSSVAQAQAASGLIFSQLRPGEKLSLEPVVASVNEDLCSGCKTCLSLCPYKAITSNTEKKKAQVSEVLCRGCGICVAGCPAAALTLQHFTDKQVRAEMKGLLSDSK